MLLTYMLFGLILYIIFIIIYLLFAIFLNDKPFKGEDLFDIFFNLIKIAGMCLVWPIFSIIGLVIIGYKIYKIFKKKKY
jgi:hypothetical protein